MINNDGPVLKHRNRTFDETHMLLIKEACKLIDKSAAGDISFSALAQVTGVNRSTIYNHFKTREELLCATQNRSREQQTADAETDISRWVGINELSALFQDNSEVITSWIDDYIASADGQERYPQWDLLLEQIKYSCSEATSEKPCDAEVYWALMASASIVASTVTNPVRRFESLEHILGVIRDRAACSAGTNVDDHQEPDGLE